MPPLFELLPPVPERLELETEPREATVASYVLTRAAERSWETFNRYLAERGGRGFWIGEPPGCGKTHFLNYVIALQERAGAIAAGESRRIVCGIPVAGRLRAGELETQVLNAIAERIGSPPGALWRKLNGADALKVALKEAGRTGIRELTLAADFGISDPGAAAGYFAALAEAAAHIGNVKFTVLAAGRGAAPLRTELLKCAPADSAEELSIAMRRARTLTKDGARRAANSYREIELGGLTPEAIFPFHPLTLEAIHQLAAPPATIAGLARIVSEALASPPARGGLIYPSDSIANAAILQRIEARLGEAGGAALEIARAAANRFEGNERKLALEMIGALALDCAAGGTAPLALDELEARVAILARGGAGEEWNRRLVAELLRRIARATGGAVRFEADAARFDPAGAGAPEVAAFNAALPLAHRFDPSIAPVRDRSELKHRIKQLRRAMATAAEAARRTHETLAEALVEAGMDRPPGQVGAIAGYAALAESGPGELIALSAGPARRDATLKTISAYEPLAMSALIVPRMRAMRAYLDATGLRARGERGADRDAALAALETECELLRIEIGPRLLIAPPPNLGTLEARFQKFKWTYVQRYLAAHERWRAEMDRLAPEAEGARRRLDALRRLDAIAALGAPEGEAFEPRVAELPVRAARCAHRGPLKPELAPRCPACGYVLGAVSPREELDDIMDGLRRALEAKLIALSQNVIARIIREHNRAHRLDGLLKIIQAANADALVRVLEASSRAIWRRCSTRTLRRREHPR
ncbi:MAG: hypothetical protein ACREQI_05635 [Candidatus Binataceae bacterium]